MAGYSFGYFRGNDAEAERIVTELLKEGRTYNLGGGWKVRVDRSIHNVDMTHNHAQFKGRDVAVINRDNTPSHGTDPGQLPNWVLKDMKKLELIESRLLMESGEDRITEEMIAFAIELDVLSHNAISAP